jgi:hypothetical protein
MQEQRSAEDTFLCHWHLKKENGAGKSSFKDEWAHLISLPDLYRYENKTLLGYLLIQSKLIPTATSYPFSEITHILAFIHSPIDIFFFTLSS